jgi:hypothetical protein
MKDLLLVMMVSVALLAVGCSKEHDYLPTSFMYDPPSIPLDLQVTGGNEQAVLNWDYPSEEMGSIREFRVYYYFEVYDLVELVDTTSSMTFTDTQLVGNLNYCYQVSAVDTTGLEGYRTEAVCAFVRTSD